MTYALAMLWHDRQRFFAAVLSVAFSTVLICVQFGLLLGMFALTSIPIDNAAADIWLGSPDVVSVDIGRPIPEHYLNRVASQPGVVAVEPYIVGFDYWDRPDGGRELVIVVGTRLAEGAVGAVSQLTPDMRAKLTELGTVVMDQSATNRLGIRGVGDVASIRGRRVRIVGVVEGLTGLQGPYLFCSLDTARELLSLRPDQVIYVVAKCRTAEDVANVVHSLRRQYPETSVLTSRGFALRSRWHWLTQTRAGVAVGFAAVLGLLVGAVVTRQSLYSATLASLREYAVLRAMGIPNWRMALNLAWLSFWIGLAGVLVALPSIFLILQIGAVFEVPIQMPWWLLASAGATTWLFAVLAGVTTLQTVRQAEPVLLLR